MNIPQNLNRLCSVFQSDAEVEVCVQMGRR